MSFFQVMAFLTMKETTYTVSLQYSGADLVGKDDTIAGLTKTYPLWTPKAPVEDTR
jgi:hypothetical protein